MKRGALAFAVIAMWAVVWAGTRIIHEGMVCRARCESAGYPHGTTKADDVCVCLEGVVLDPTEKAKP